METTNENIRQLLEMLDNPDAYTEREIRYIINRDENTRETYRLMVEARRSCSYRRSHTPVDVDAAWQRFNRKFRHRRGPQACRFGWMRVAASFIGVILVSGIAFAAIRFVQQYLKQGAPQTRVAENMTGSITVIPADTLANDTVIVQPVTYDNIPLERMLPEIAAHYDVKVVFDNDATRQLRFRFVWNPQLGIDQVVNDLNRFEHLTVTLKDNRISVE